MPPHLRISINPDLNMNALSETILNLKKQYEKIHIMFSDGLIFDRRTFKNIEGLAFQRVLNPYQLEKALIDTDQNPHIIILKSEVVDSWDLYDIQALYDILKIKSYGTGCRVTMNIIGPGGVFENYLGSKVINRLYREEENELKMGRTTPTARQTIDHLVEKYSELSHLMNSSDSEALKQMLLYGRQHSPEISASNIEHETGFILSIILEITKKLKRLESKAEME